MMASIYSQGENVVAWLGYSYEVGEDLTSASYKEVLLFLEKCSLEIYDMHGLDAKFNIQPLSGSAREFSRGCFTLSRKRYWTRVWIIQEIALASQAIIQCGSYGIRWSYFRSICLGLRSKNWVEIWGTPMENLMGKTDEKKHKHFLAGLCWDLSKAECENDLHKVFGLWALAPQCCREGVPVDYLLTLEQVLQKLVAHNNVAHDYKISKRPLPERVDFWIHYLLFHMSSKKEKTKSYY
jgi:hypothetical protein